MTRNWKRALVPVLIGGGVGLLMVLLFDMDLLSLVALLVGLLIGGWMLASGRPAN
jgi:hypothetical protein